MEGNVLKFSRSGNYTRGRQPIPYESPDDRWATIVPPTHNVCSSKPAMNESILLQVPADPGMSRIARLAAGGLCSVLGFDVEQIEDVKIAVSEIVLALIENGEGRDITLRFETDLPGTRSSSSSNVSQRQLAICGTTTCSDFDGTAADMELCRAVLSGVALSSSINFTGTDAEIRVILPGVRA